jgi:hypothetical protein
VALIILSGWRAERDGGWKEADKSGERVKSPTYCHTLSHKLIIQKMTSALILSQRKLLSEKRKKAENETAG